MSPLSAFDDIECLQQSATPALTTVRQPFDRISEEMVRLLLDVISRQAPGRRHHPHRTGDPRIGLIFSR
jgi:DNA-binding LacI/PurR family transcriptional regulator